MALKPTIYKTKIALSDLNRDYYDALSFTLAQHPSETLERMMTRTLAYCLNAEKHLTFTKGLNDIEEPDIWCHSLDGVLETWIDIGEPAFDRVKKSSRLARNVRVYCFNSKSDVWWDQGEKKMSALNVSVFRFNWNDIQTLARFVERSMEWSITITGNSAYIATAKGECEVTWENLQTV